MYLYNMSSCNTLSNILGCYWS